MAAATHPDDDAIAFGRTLNFAETGDFPLPRMRNRARPDYVQIDIDHASSQIVVATHAGGIVAVFPERGDDTGA